MDDSRTGPDSGITLDLGMGIGAGGGGIINELMFYWQLIAKRNLYNMYIEYRFEICKGI